MEIELLNRHEGQSRKYNDSLISTKSTTLPPRPQAYGVEQVRIEMNGGVKSARNYNRKNSPGLKIIKNYLGSDGDRNTN